MDSGWGERVTLPDQVSPSCRCPRGITARGSKLAETVRSDAQRSVTAVRAKVELVLDRGSLVGKQMVVG